MEIESAASKPLWRQRQTQLARVAAVAMAPVLGMLRVQALAGPRLSH
jgi:hypothetical protein